jgi:hypothetical protein
MRLPTQAPAVIRSASIEQSVGSVHVSGCNVFKKIACGAAIAACGAVCVGSLGTACVQCLAGIGASGCIDCF